MPIQTRQRAFLVSVGLIMATCLSAASLSTLATEPNLSGTWAATVHIPDASTSDATLSLQQDGVKLSGYITNSYGRQSEVTGAIVGTQIQLSYTSPSIKVRTDSGDKQLTLNYSGSASNDEIDAKATTPLGESTLKAKRK